MKHTLEEERQARLEELAARRARKMARAMRADSVLAAKRGVRAISMFLNPLSAIEESDRDLNPEAKYEAEFDDEKLLYELESPAHQVERSAAWQLLVSSISGQKGIKKSFWKHVGIGNVHKLFQLITAHFMDGDRSDVAAELSLRLSKFVKEKDENFVTFVSRYEQMKDEMDEIGMNVDDDVLKNTIENAMTESEDKKVRDVYEQFTLMNGEMKTPEELFEKMKVVMKRHEKAAREEAAKKEQEMKYEKVKSKKDKKRERKKRQKAEDESSSSSSEDEKEKTLALKASAYQQKKDENVPGVCFWYQENKCERKDCTFEHRKLSEKGKQKLREIMKERKERKSAGGSTPFTPTCYACGEKGHIATQCSKKSVVKKAVSSDSSGKHTFKELISVMSDEQVKMFAAEVCRLQADAGDGAGSGAGGGAHGSN